MQGPANIKASEKEDERRRAARVKYVKYGGNCFYAALGVKSGQISSFKLRILFDFRQSASFVNQPRTRLDRSSRVFV
jgi:hypothetical protein